jgi:hypothetical protein
MPNAFTPDLNTASSQLAPFIQSLSGKIPVFGRASKAEKNLRRVITALQNVEVTISNYDKIEQLSLNELLILMLQNLGKIQKHPHLFMHTPQTGTAELLELMNDILSAKPARSSKELNKLIKKITKLQTQLESASSGLRYASAGGKLVISAALGVIGYYSTMIFLDWMMMIIPAALSIGISLLFTSTILGITLGLAAAMIVSITGGFKLLFSGANEIRQTYDARNPSTLQEKIMEEQLSILDVIRNKFDAQQGKPSECEKTTQLGDYILNFNK